MAMHSQIVVNSRFHGGTKIGKGGPILAAIGPGGPVLAGTDFFVTVCLDFKSQIMKTFTNSVNYCKFLPTLVAQSIYIIKIYFEIQSKYFKI